MKWRRKVLQSLQLIRLELAAIRAHQADLEAWVQDMRRQLDVGRLEEAAADVAAVEEMARTRGLPPYLGDWDADTATSTGVPVFTEGS